MTHIFRNAALLLLVCLGMPVAAAPDPVKVAVQACTAPTDASPGEILSGFGWEELDAAGSAKMARPEAEAAGISALIVLPEKQVRDLVAKRIAKLEATPADTSQTPEDAPLRRFALPDTAGLLLMLSPGDVPGAYGCTIAIPRSINDTGFHASLRLISQVRPDAGAKTSTLTRDGTDLLTSLRLPANIPSTIREGGTARAGPPRGIAEFTLFTLAKDTFSDWDPPFNTRASLSISFTPTGD